MKNKHICVLTLISLFMAVPVHGQDHYIPTAAWYLPGISYEASSRFRFVTQLGYSEYVKGFLAYPQALYVPNKYLTLGASYFYYRSALIAGKPYTEHDVVGNVIGCLPLRKIVLEDRNQVFAALYSSAEKRQLYRNRLRLLVPYTLFRNQGKAYVFDEGFYLFNEGKWYRNRVAIGNSFDLQRWLNLDVTYIWQSDSFSGRLNMVFVALMVQLKRKH
ncbi:DUF2490 domain-containing protein [Chitinophaga agrisoli]|uniref:DUF2490 domain-containing protein n=1 Tax=Chitinophaga agrisoli TaxID=2607653 RepID=A0A5B2VX08_9BACT|nr:DUF2490 domain-containing protein [Chitinophaga agrisoli]KAA2243314.1 DUF2490 domain-containing protein [Chitinophaga agrisoli]